MKDMTQFVSVMARQILVSELNASEEQIDRYTADVQKIQDLLLPTLSKASDSFSDEDKIALKQEQDASILSFMVSYIRDKDKGKMLGVSVKSDDGILRELPLANLAMDYTNHVLLTVLKAKMLEA